MVSESLVKWNEYPLSLLAKLLFLLDKGDRATLMTNQVKRLQATAEAFCAILLAESCSSELVVNELQKRVKVLENYGFFELRSGTEAAKYHVIQQDEDLLLFNDTCHHLGIQTSNALEDKIKKVQRKLKLNPSEATRNFFMHSESLCIIKMCNLLTPGQVHQFLDIIKKNNIFSQSIVQYLTVSEESLKQIDGVKECLFLYIIQFLKYNGIYDETIMRLEQEAETNREKDIIKDLVKDLRSYPSKCHPSGYCIVFCNMGDGDGRENEIANVQKVFNKSLGFLVEVQSDPSEETINTTLENLESPKYRFYDSLVVWFIGKGENRMELANGTYYSKRKIIDNFSRLKTFSKKPKIIFMVSNPWEEAIPSARSGK